MGVIFVNWCLVSWNLILVSWNLIRVCSQAGCYASRRGVFFRNSQYMSWDRLVVVVLEPWKLHDFCAHSHLPYILGCLPGISDNNVVWACLRYTCGALLRSLLGSMLWIKLVCLFGTRKQCAGHMSHVALWCWLPLYSCEFESLLYEKLCWILWVSCFPKLLTQLLL